MVTGLLVWAMIMAGIALVYAIGNTGKIIDDLPTPAPPPVAPEHYLNDADRLWLIAHGWKPEFTIRPV